MYFFVVKWTETMFLTLGENYKISVKEVFAQNRQRLWKSLFDKEGQNTVGMVIYMQGGLSETRFDSDHEPIFRQESYFLWLTGVQEPDCAIMMTYDTTTLFIPRLPPSYATIMGHIKTPEEWKQIYQVDDVQFADTAENTLLLQLKSKVVAYSHSSEHNSLESNMHVTPRLLVLEGENSDSGKLYQPPTFNSPDLHPFMDKTILFPILANNRVFKSSSERDLIRHVTEVTSFAHVFVMRHTRPLQYEYQCESLFRHYCYYNFGCRLVSYTPICGCGPNSAVLHYGHSGEPNSRQLTEGDMCLFDMGAEYFGYGSDVTCSFPANGIFTPQQRCIWEAVAKAQLTVYAMLRPGVSWVDCHLAAEASILQSLVDIGLLLLNGSTITELVQRRLGAVFMPHGLGHFLGIDTHDVGGYLPGYPTRIREPGLQSLRTARILAESMVLTVEPGCYFIDHLLDEALDGGEFGKHLNVGLLNSVYRGFGGVRLEDVVFITETGFINYTLCPRTVEEVESVMAGGKWPPMHDDAPQFGRERLTKAMPLLPDIIR
jgi:Xaa-Pro dipeptidase